LQESLTDTVCSFCSIGCKTRLTSNGNLLLRSIPTGEGTALLCNKGRFGFEEIRKAQRVESPLVRVGNGMQEASFEQAVERTASTLRSLQAEYGNDCVALAISGRYTNEEAFLIRHYAQSALQTSRVYSLGLTNNGIEDVFGRNASTASMNDLENAQLIIAIEPQDGILRSTAAMRIRRAVRRGAHTQGGSPRCAAFAARVPVCAGERPAQQYCFAAYRLGRRFGGFAADCAGAAG